MFEKNIFSDAKICALISAHADFNKIYVLNKSEAQKLADLLTKNLPKSSYGEAFNFCNYGLDKQLCYVQITPIGTLTSSFLLMGSIENMEQVKEMVKGSTEQLWEILSSCLSYLLRKQILIQLVEGKFNILREVDIRRGMSHKLMGLDGYRKFCSKPKVESPKLVTKADLPDWYNAVEYATY